MNTKIIELEKPYSFESPFNKEEFVLFLYINDKSISNETQRKLSRQFISRGCRYAVCGGYNCEEWHDSIDSVCIGNNKNSDKNFIMTTWHDDETIDDIVFFFVNNTSYENFIPENFCIVLLGKNLEIKNKILSALEKEKKNL